MNNKNLQQKESIKASFKSKILKALEYHFPTAKIYLFGSRANKTHLEGADVDIALDIGEKIHPREIYRAELTLENLYIPLEVDLLDLNAVPEHLRKEILENGILWKK